MSSDSGSNSNSNSDKESSTTTTSSSSSSSTTSISSSLSTTYKQFEKQMSSVKECTNQQYIIMKTQVDKVRSVIDDKAGIGRSHLRSSIEQLVESTNDSLAILQNKTENSILVQNVSKTIDDTKIIMNTISTKVDAVYQVRYEYALHLIMGSGIIVGGTIMGMKRGRRFLGLTCGLLTSGIMSTIIYMPTDSLSQAVPKNVSDVQKILFATSTTDGERAKRKE